MDPTVTTGSNVNAIDIPTSPRPFIPSYRRSSSVAQRRVAQVSDEVEGDCLGCGTRSASMGAGDRQQRDQPVNLNSLLGLQNEDGAGAEQFNDVDNLPGPVRRRPVVNERTSSLNQANDFGGSASASPRNTVQQGLQHEHGVYRSRFSRGGVGRGLTPPHGSSTSLGSEKERETTGSGSASGDATGERRGGRYSLSRPALDHRFEDEEPLLFDMSELGGKRSFDDGRGGVETRRGSRRGGGAGGGGGGNGSGGGGGGYHAWT